MTIEILIMALMVLTLNVLDSVTTHLAFKQYPDKEFKGEGNPLMRRLMLKNKWLAEVVKQLLILAIVSYLLYKIDLDMLHFMAICLGLVVLNNTVVISSRAILKRKVRTPIKMITKFLHIPEKYDYGFAISIILLFSFYMSWLMK